MHCRLKFDIGWSELIWAIAGPPISPAQVRRAHTSVRETFGQFNTVVALSVRTLFDAFLSELNLPDGAPILMSGITIRHMADIAENQGLRVVAVDIEPDTLLPRPGVLLRAQAETGASICVIAQLYGAVSDIDDAPELRKRGVLVVEDAAQSFAGPASHWDRGADISLLSFGPIKRRTALGGALGLFHDAKLATAIRNRLSHYPARTDSWFRSRAAKYLMLKAASRPIAYSLLNKVIEILGRDPDTTIAEMARGFSGPSFFEAIRHKPPLRMVSLMASQIQRAPSSETRIAICEDFLDGQTAPAPATSAQRHFHWVVPVTVSQPNKIVRTMRASGFDATLGATSLCALTPDDTPSARSMIDHVIYLPHPADMNALARERMRTALADAVQKYG